VRARIWQAANKIVDSKSPEAISTLKTRPEREFDPQAVRDLKAQLPHGASVGGPTLAAQAIRSGLVGAGTDLFVAAIMLGVGKPILPGNVGVKLCLFDERRFASGMVYLRYHMRA
jgi:hypothetical protein